MSAAAAAPPAMAPTAATVESGPVCALCGVRRMTVRIGGAVVCPHCDRGCEAHAAGRRCGLCANVSARTYPTLPNPTTPEVSP